jgi:hypothetical protein
MLIYVYLHNMSTESIRLERTTQDLSILFLQIYVCKSTDELLARAWPRGLVLDQKWSLINLHVHYHHLDTSDLGVNLFVMMHRVSEV